MILTVNSRIRDLENHSIYLLLKCCKNLSWLSFRSVFIIFNFKLQISEEENYNVENQELAIEISRQRFFSHMLAKFLIFYFKFLFSVVKSQHRR